MMHDAIATSRASLIRRTYLALLFDGLCVSGASVILPVLREQYALNYDFSGLLLALLSAGNLISALLFGLLAHRLGARWAAALFCCGMAAGYLLLAGSGQPALLLLGFGLIGLAKGASMNHGTVLVGNAVADRTRGVNMINAMYALGSLCMPFLSIAALRGGLPWRTPLFVLAAAGAALWLLFFGIRPGSASAAQKAGSRAAKDGTFAFLRETHFWFATALLFCQQCAEISVTGWLVTYYKEQGILTGIFSQLTVTVIWAAMLIARLFISFVLPPKSKLRSLALMSGASLVTYALMLLADSGPTAVLTLFLFGISIAGIYPTAIAQASKGLSNASVGVQLPVAGIGSVVMPYVTGTVAEKIGIRGGMACSLVALLFMLVFALLLRRCDRKEAAQQESAVSS